MARVILGVEAQKQLDRLPLHLNAQVQQIIERLAKWPEVSGVKPLRGDLHGNYRIRTGAYRIVFSVSADGATVTIWKIGNRRGLYD